MRVNFDGLGVKPAWLLLTFATSRMFIRTTSPFASPAYKDDSDSPNRTDNKS
jgi:hypothetical protein